MEERVWTGELVSLRRLAPPVVELQVMPESGFSFAAGEYVELQASLGEEERTFPFSIASGPARRPLEFCIRDGTPELASWLGGLEEGQRFAFRGPFGRFHYHPAPQRDLVMIATGTGIAPLRSMLQSASYQESRPERGCLLFGARREEELLYREEWDAYPELTFVPVLSHLEEEEPWSGARGFVTHTLRAHPERFRWEETEFYICGQPEMVQETRELLLGHGVQEDAIHHERW